MKTSEEIFTRGEVEKLLARSTRAGENYWPWVAAYAQKGDYLRAEHFAEKAWRSSNLFDGVASLSFWAVGSFRSSDYKRAQKLVKKIYSFRQSHDPKIRAMAYWAPALYFFFRAELGRAQRLCEKALRATLDSEWLYFETVCVDLLAYILMGRGQVKKGMEFFRRALENAEAMGNAGLSSTLRIAILRYEMHFALRPVAELQKNISEALRSLRPDDNYSRSELLLEYARHLTLRGELKAAESTLNEAAEIIYAFQIRRQIALLNMRYAYLQFLRGESYKALSLLHASESNLDHTTDHPRLHQLGGLKAAILEHLGQKKSPVPADPQRAFYPSQRSAQRQEKDLNSEVAFPRGEDLLGDLLDDAKGQTSQALDRVWDSGYWGLLREFLPNELLRDSDTVLMINLPANHWGLYQKGEVHLSPQALSPRSRGLLELLCEGWQTKEKIVKTLWRYDYHPLRHDSLVYVAMSSLKQQLGAFASLVESSEAGYRLVSGVKVFDFLKRGSTLSKVVNEPEKLPRISWRNFKTLDTESPQLSFRHLRILENFKGAESFTLQEVKKLEKISTMSAYRDLQFLLHENLIEKRGWSRATRYRITAQEVTV